MPEEGPGLEMGLTVQGPEERENEITGGGYRTGTFLPNSRDPEASKR